MENKDAWAIPAAIFAAGLAAGRVAFAIPPGAVRDFNAKPAS